MIMRVATFSMNERMLNASLRTQAKMAEMQMQSASGVMSTDYGGFSGSARTLINLDISHQRAATFQAAAAEADARVATMLNALQGDTAKTGVIEVLKSFISAIVGMRSTDRTPMTSLALIEGTQANLESLASSLNTQHGGRHLFGGSETTHTPVDLDGAYGATDPMAGPSTDYYSGDEALAQVQVGSDHTVTYGVAANEPAFEEALRALRMISTADANTLDDDTLKAALELASSALDGATVIYSRLAVTSGVLKDAVESQEQYQFTLEVNITNLKGVDHAALAVQLTNYETQLTASFSALAKIQSIDLNDYLR